MSEVTVLIVVGSLRAASLNRELAQALVANPPAGVRVRIAEGIGEVPFYNEDIDPKRPDTTAVGGALPPAVVSLREQIRTADALLLLAPPYNGTMSAVLKNVIDWGSRPYGRSVLSGKRVAVAGVGHRLDTVLTDAARAVTIAGGVVPDGLVARFPVSALGGGVPSQHDELVQQAQAIVAQLAGTELVGTEL